MFVKKKNRLYTGLNSFSKLTTLLKIIIPQDT